MPVNVRSRSGQRCSRSTRGNFAVHRTSRQSLDCLRVRVLANLPPSEIGPPRCGPDRDRAWQFRHAMSAPWPLVARLRSSPSGSRARHRLIAAHYCVAARSAPLHALSPCPACASPRQTRTAVRLIAALAPQGYVALIAHVASGKMRYVLPGTHTGFSPHCPTFFGHRLDSMRWGHSPKIK